MRHPGCYLPTWPLARYIKLWFAHAPGMPGAVSPPPRVRDPGMHHDTCVTHMPWCMPGKWWRENVPGIIGACATRNFTFLVRGSCFKPMYLVPFEKHKSINHVSPNIEADPERVSPGLLSLKRFAKSASRLGMDKWLHGRKWWGVITHPCPNFNGVFVKPQLKSEHGWVITSHIKRVCDYLAMPWMAQVFSALAILCNYEIKPYCCSHHKMYSYIPTVSGLCYHLG